MTEGKRPWWAQELQALREAAGLSINAAAKKAGIHARSWTDTEYALHAPSIVKLEKMLGAVGAELEVMEL